MAFIDSNGHKRIKRTDCKSESDKAFRNVANDNVILNTAAKKILGQRKRFIIRMRNGKKPYGIECEYLDDPFV